MPTDAAGLTQEDVATMSLHEEFEAYRQHYEHMQELLAGAQRSVNHGPWDWIGGDRVPGIGGDGLEPLPGADTLNSYDLRTDRIWEPPGATGDARDLQPMVDYFDEQGWRHREGHPGRDHDTWAKTDDGWQIEYVVQSNGRYSLTVYSELFWTNDDLALMEAVGGRSDGDYPDESLPGEYPPFPDWDDPIINPPKI
ncbi:hypothetical protein HUN58_01330 [Curtobacterium sp. Csp1]|uniref:hypothetical protein n=1 Tax=unclassified Curtobacterium TaxID=257496 RepID=UPI001598BB1B|nr:MULTISPECIES: hypothetical protein [unclassified Curtobacterium]QKS13400.1 hypothetical protein HUN60_09820 [Curtobacterium sp. csp3]QKS18714.1 hypothetical protein HUN58_01330 [Curtobacterium sp. Csp1]